MSLLGIDLDFVVLVLAALTVFASVLGLAYPLLQADPLASRLKHVTKRREELSKQQTQRLQETRRQRANSRDGFMKMVLDRLRLQGQTTSRALRMKLARAGWRGQVPMITYVFARVATPVALGMVAALILIGADKPMLTTNVKILIAAAAAAFGYYLPGIIVANVVQRRQQELMRHFPDALDLMVLCVEAGLSLDAALTRVASDIEENSPVLAEELGLTSAELALLGDRRAAIENLAERTGLEDFKSFAMALIQSERYGTSLGTILRVLARDNRDARMTRAEEKAGRLPATLTVPMITFFMPVLFIVLIGPAIIQTIRTFQ
jgi:tight adherence protein C